MSRMKNLLTHEITIPEDTVFEILLSQLEDMGYVGEIHRNVEVPLEGIAFVPDLYLPQLALVISVDGRIHEHGYEDPIYRRQQLSDVLKDYIFKRAGINIHVVFNHETANRASLSVRLRSILKALIDNPPTQKDLNKTKKAIFNQRMIFASKYPERFESRKKGYAGIQFRRNRYHHYFGSKFLMKKKKSGPNEV